MEENLETKTETVAEEKSEFEPKYLIQEEYFDSLKCRCACAPSPTPPSPTPYCR